MDINVEIEIDYGELSVRGTDLRFYLVSPIGTRVELSSGEGNLPAVVLDDEAAVSIASLRSPCSGRFRPNEPLSSFDEERSGEGSGVWTLEIQNPYRNTPTLRSWSLGITGGLHVVAEPDLQTTEDGGDASFTVALDRQPTADVIVSVTSSDLSEGVVAPSSLLFTPADWDVARTVTITGVDDAVYDGDIAYRMSLEATSSDVKIDGLKTQVKLVNLDNDPVPGITVSPTSGLITSESGGSASFSVALDTPPTHGVTIPVSSSISSEGTVDKTSLTFTPSNWDLPQIVTVTGVDDADVDGDQLYTIDVDPAVSDDSNYDGLDAVDVAAVNLDNDQPPEVTISATDANASEPGTNGGEFTVTRTGDTIAALDVVFTVAGTATEGEDLPGRRP